MFQRLLTRIFATAVILLPALLADTQPAAVNKPQVEELQAVSAAAAFPKQDRVDRSSYVLGPDDQIAIRVVDVDEMGNMPLRINAEGTIQLPYLGNVHAGGLTVEQLRAEVAARLQTYVREPDVTVSIIEFHSQPVSVFGAVRSPGVHQLQGRKTLVEILSLAGGLEPAAGPNVKITRKLEWGRIPLKGAWDDPTGQFSVAEVSVKGILEARNPEENVLIRPHDVVSVPRAEMVYVAGQVMKAGAFMLNERENMSVLEALTLAGGTDRFAAPQHSRILRASSRGKDRQEIPVNVKKILQGKAEDIALLPDDILFVPDSTPKRGALRALEAVVQTGTGVIIWRR